MCVSGALLLIELLVYKAVSFSGMRSEGTAVSVPVMNTRINGSDKMKADLSVPVTNTVKETTK
jgi:hypothetical protein